MNPMMMGMGPMVMVPAWAMDGGDGGWGKGWGKGSGKGWGKGKDGKMSPFKFAMERIKKMDDTCKIFVQNLPEEAKWKELNAHFAAAGHKPLVCETYKGGRGVCAF